MTSAAGSTTTPLPRSPQTTNIIQGAGFVRFEKPLKAVDPADWPQEFTREERELQGILLPPRNKFTTEQLQTVFRYLGGYRRQKSVPPELIRRLRITYPDFQNAFCMKRDKTIADKIRSWPKDENLFFV